MMGGKRKASQDLRGHSLTVEDLDVSRKALDGPTEDDLSRDSHYAELYAKPPDFQQLALQDADFARL